MDEDDERVIKITCVPWSRMILKKKSVIITSIVNDNLHYRRMFGHKNGEMHAKVFQTMTWYKKNNYWLITTIRNESGL